MSKRTPRQARAAARKPVSPRGRRLIRPATDADLAKVLPLKTALTKGQIGRKLQIEAGALTRGKFALAAAGRLPGFRWDVPPPDTDQRVISATIGFDWQFWRWYSQWLNNSSGSKIHVDGSVDWRWELTGNPDFVANDVVLMQDGGHFQFETFIPPGGDGYDVGWIVPAKSTTFTGNSLADLIKTKKDGALRLWFGVSLTNVVLTFNGHPGGGPYAMGGGPNTLNFSYAYTSQLLSHIDLDDLVLIDQ